MATVQRAVISAAIVGGAAATALALAAATSLPWWACVAGLTGALGYLGISNAVLLRGLRARRETNFGPANTVTAVRSTLVGLITGMIVASFFAPIPVALLIALVVSALVLDGLDGWVARRTNSASELGARFDMEVDAFLLLALSAFVSQSLGAWVLAIGLMRYAFVAAAWVLPWLNRRLPFRHWRKIVTAVQGIALTAAAAGAPPVIATGLVVIALALLVESFGRDVIWLAARRTQTDAPVGAS